MGPAWGPSALTLNLLEVQFRTDRPVRSGQTSNCGLAVLPRTSHAWDAGTRVWRWGIVRMAHGDDAFCPCAATKRVDSVRSPHVRDADDRESCARRSGDRVRDATPAPQNPPFLNRNPLCYHSAAVTGRP